MWGGQISWDTGRRRLDSQLGEHLNQSVAQFSPMGYEIACSHEAFGIENLHRAHKYRFFSYCYANFLGNFTRYYFYNSQSTHWNGILQLISRNFGHANCEVGWEFGNYKHEIIKLINLVPRACDPREGT